MYLIYSFISVAAHLVLAPYFLLRPRTRRKYLPSLKQRLSVTLPAPTPPGKRCVWVHAVSVGEVLAVRKLVEALVRYLPDHRIVLSTVTVTGNELALRTFSPRDVFFLPLDWPPIIRRFLSCIRPEVVLCAESELWPNFYRSLRTSGVPVAIVNGRVTPTSFRNYRFARGLFRSVLSAVQLCLMQTEEDAQRIRSLGAVPETVRVLGNLKYDLTLEESPGTRKTIALIQRALGLDGATLVLVAGSTMPGEEEAVLALYGELRQEHPRLKLILAARHPGRFNEVGEKMLRTGWAVVRRSQLDEGPPEATDRQPEADLLLLDSIGELPYVYQLATLAFVGGSLVPHGGHNILEPAYYGKPILIGPHMENFKEIAENFLRGGGAVQAADLAELKKVAARLLADSRAQSQLGNRAREIIQRSGGSLQNTLNLILPWIGKSGPSRPGTLSSTT